jgi:hypothetical protein
VTVGAEEREVLEAIVVPLAVAVVELERQRGVTPFGDAALLASVLLEAGGDEAELDVRPMARDFDEQLLKRHRVWTRRNRPSLHGIGPRPGREAELLRALALGVTLVVVGLNGLPVVAPGEALIQRITQLPLVVSDRPLGDAKQPGNLLDAPALLEQLANPLASPDPWNGYPP